MYWIWYEIDPDLSPNLTSPVRIFFNASEYPPYCFELRLPEVYEDESRREETQDGGQDVEAERPAQGEGEAAEVILVTWVAAGVDSRAT